MQGTKLASVSYQSLLKPILFKTDPEWVHDQFTQVGSFLGKHKIARATTAKVLRFDDVSLRQDLFGSTFANPVGLSAGFDYNGKLSTILGAVGFGFMSAGTVTNRPYGGNVKPRLGRLPASKALLVNKGFKSSGIDAFLSNLKNADDIKLGISIGATNAADTTTASTQIEDIVTAVKKLNKHPLSASIAYLELNISCPNVLGSGNLATPASLTKLLQKINKLNLSVPIFIKFPIEIDWKQAKPLVKIMIDHRVSAVVIGNLLKNRQSPTLDQNEMHRFAKQKGNISGKPTTRWSNQLIGKTYQEYGDKIAIIGVGGIFSARDAYEKIKLGASLVQLITGMIYQGPQLIGEINRDLVKLLKQDGYSHISQAIGAYYQ